MARARKAARREEERVRKKQRNEAETSMNKRGPRPLEFVDAMDETELLDPVGGFDTKYEASISIAEFQAKHGKVRARMHPGHDLMLGLGEHDIKGQDYPCRQSSS